MTPDNDKGGRAGHRPVMLAEVLAALNPRDGAIYVDGTFGAGGYATALLDSADCVVWGIDRDPDAVARGAVLARRYHGRLTVVAGRYAEMVGLLDRHGVGCVDGVALDLGVSSMQLDESGRGFSFRHDGPLDMRMARAGPSAADIVNGTDEQPLADIIYRYGEERWARRIARAIVETRRDTPIVRTAQLAAIVRAACPRGSGRRAGEIDPATRTFQALRIHVNDEIGELAAGLPAAEALLGPGGRLAVVTFHSLEDREVKAFLRDRAGAAPRVSRHRPDPGGDGPAATFRLLSRRVARPTAQEVAANPRARSARMRAAERTDAPARGAGGAP